MNVDLTPHEIAYLYGMLGTREDALRGQLRRAVRAQHQPTVNTVGAEMRTVQSARGKLAVALRPGSSRHP